MNDIESVAATGYDPVERVSELELKGQVSLIQNAPFVKQAFDAANVTIIVINRQRQIIFANKAFLNLLKLESVSPLLGKRPGEAINCIHAEDNDNGCGTAEACHYCDGTNLMKHTITNNEETSGEVTFNTKGYEFTVPYNFFASTTPFAIADQEFFVLTLKDISDTTRRRQLERVFFHDIINSSGGLYGLMSILKEDMPELLKPKFEYIESGLAILVDEILFHKKLLEAENGELVCDFRTLKSGDVIETVIQLYRNHDVANGKKIIVSEDSGSFSFKSDLMLLSKVMGNMIKNALEHTAPGGTVTVGCEAVHEYIEFWVHNHGFIPTAIQYKISQRNFSTKGRGRGLGTYSIKLFTEKYLHGRAYFTTDEEKGTTFSIRISRIE